METPLVGLVAALSAAAGAAAAWFLFWFNLAGRIAAIERDAKNALQDSAENKQETTTMRDAMAAHAAAFNLYQVHVAREYADKDMIREMEARVVGAVEKAAKASAEQIAGLAKRIDGLTDGRHPHHRS